MTIRAALMKLMQQSKPMHTVLCKVEAVDITEATCDAAPVDGSPIYYKVRLRATIDSSQAGIIIIPVIGSYVLVGCISDIDDFRYVILYDQIQSIEIVCDDIRLNGVGNGGVVKVSELISAINRLETIVSSHQHAYASPGGPAVTTPSPVPATLQTIAPITTIADLQSTTVKHG